MTLLDNKKARFDYEILEDFEAGIHLLGFEVKALKTKKGSIVGAHIIIRGGEAFIVGMDIPPYQPLNTPKDYDPQRTRKLLLHKKEISYLEGKDSQKGLTLIPFRVYTKGGFIKISFAVARGMKKYDKREKIKKRDVERELGRSLKN